MDFDISLEQKMIRDAAREFAEREVAPVARRLDQESLWPRELVGQLGKLGLMGVAVSEQWGGAGADSISYVLAVEEISAACASLGVIMSVNNSLVCDPLERFGTDAQRDSVHVG